MHTIKGNTSQDGTQESEKAVLRKCGGKKVPKQNKASGVITMWTARHLRDNRRMNETREAAR
jgi:hypothetical protein